MHAFPPAPYHTLYGMVRDENGQALRADGGEVVFYRDGVEFLRTPITETSRIDQNYQIRLRMDMHRFGTESYTSLANVTGTTFSLSVILNNIVYQPIEMSQSRAIGQPGERVRLNLTLGVDSDGDGIPDAWKISQLYAAGILPGEDGWDLSLIDRDGDFDGDGVSNWEEYIAGTFATDPNDFLALQIIESQFDHVLMRFYGIFGKVYNLEASTDLQTWTPVPLILRAPGSTEFDEVEDMLPPQPAVRAENTAFIDLYAPSDASAPTFYRLRVR
ncbi:MAG: hypothetical protein JJU05_09315 [Verrucomicrobia bacterium]|nr:hypothetical protein [Verrucomicrobiota bacterium]MCH8527591.1 hypothetical protein [Kiritimatiellia bacterium]